MAKTHDDFVKELLTVNPEIEVIGKYTRAVDHIEVKCKKCDKVWSPKAYSLTSGKSCPHCSAIRGSQKNGGINNGCPTCSKSKMGTHKKRVMNIETGKVFDSAIQAGEQYGTVPSAIRQCCRGKSKTSNGYHWKHIEWKGGIGQLMSLTQSGRGSDRDSRRGSSFKTLSERPFGGANAAYIRPSIKLLGTFRKAITREQLLKSIKIDRFDQAADGFLQRF